MTAIADLSDADRDRLYDAGELRWIGVTPPDGKYLEIRRMMVGDAAQTFADAVIEGADERQLEWRREAYLRYREELRVAENAHRAMWRDAHNARFAGWIIREADLQHPEPPVGP